MGSWQTDWYPAVLAAMRSLRGDGTTGTDGNVMPLLLPADGIAILRQVSPGLISALTANSRLNGDGFAGKAVRSDLLDEDGTLYPLVAMSRAGADGGFISISDYVAGIGFPGYAYRRSLVLGGDLYEIFLIDALTGTESQLLSVCRQAVGDWQGAVDAAAVMLSMAASTDQYADNGAVSAFLSRLRGLCSDLDVLRENPPVTPADKVKAAAVSALHDTEQFVGQAAADIAAEAGTGAGLVAKGFFAEAGATSLAVAGLAVYLVIR
jgi:hypothetical protein